VFNGGSPITRYQYTFTNTGTPVYANFTPDISGTTSTGIITGLTNGTTYTVYVRAVNAVNNGLPSTVGLTFTPNVVPTAPRDLSGTAGLTTINLTWNDPVTGAPFTNYEYSLDNSSNFIAFSPVDITSPATISGLASGRLYQVRLRAVNAIGPGAATTNISVRTTSGATAPGPPTILSATPGNTSATINWSLPNNGGSVIERYEYSTTGPNSGFTDFNPSVTNPTATSGTITGLTNGTNYTVYVRAVNIIGPGTSSAGFSPVTPSTIPSTPTIVTAVAGNQSATISWSPVVNGGSPITRYQYSIISDVSGFTSFNPDVSGTAASGTITGLTNGTNYTVYVRAVNARGNGPASLSTSVRPNVFPAAPIGLSGIAGFQSINLSWTAPPTGAPFTNYEYALDASGFVPFNPAITTATSATIGGLSNGRQYQVRIRAVNAIAPGVTSNTISATPVNLQTIPGAPRIQGGVGGDKSAKITWLAPSSDGGSAIIRYQYAFTNVDASFNNFVPDASGSDLSGTVRDLTNGTPSTIYVRAVNGIGSGPASQITVTPNLIIRGITFSQNPPIKNTPFTLTLDISGSYRSVGQYGWFVESLTYVGTIETNKTEKSVQYQIDTQGQYSINYDLTTQDGTYITYRQSFFLVDTSGGPLEFFEAIGGDGVIPFVNFKPPPQYVNLFFTLTGASGGGGGGSGTPSGGSSSSGAGGGGGGGGAYITGNILTDASSIYSVRFDDSSYGGVGGLPDGIDALDSSDTILTIQGLTTTRFIAESGKGGKGARGATPGNGGSGGAIGNFPPGVSGVAGGNGNRGVENIGGTGGMTGDGEQRSGNGGNGSDSGEAGNSGGSGRFRLVFSVYKPPEIFSLMLTPNPPIKSRVTRLVPNVVGSYIKVSNRWFINGAAITNGIDASGLNYTFDSSGRYLVRYSLTTAKNEILDISQTVFVVAVSGDPIQFNSINGPVDNFLVPRNYNGLNLYVAGGSGGGAGGSTTIGGGGGGGGAAIYAVSTIDENNSFSFFAGTGGTPGTANGNGGPGGLSKIIGKFIGDSTEGTLTIARFETIINGGGGGSIGIGGGGGEDNNVVLGTRILEGQDGSGTTTSIGGLGGVVGFKEPGVEIPDPSGNPFNLRGGRGGNAGAPGNAGSAGIFAVTFQQPLPPRITSINGYPVLDVDNAFVAVIENNDNKDFIRDIWTINGTDISSADIGFLSYTPQSVGVINVTYTLTTALGTFAYTQTFYVVQEANANITINSPGLLRNFTVPYGYTEMEVNLVGGSGGGGGGESGLAAMAVVGAGGGGGGGGWINGIINVSEDEVINIGQNPISGQGGAGASFSGQTRQTSAIAGGNGTDATLTYKKTNGQTFTAIARGGAGGGAGNVFVNGLGGAGGTNSVGTFWADTTSVNGFSGVDGGATNDSVGGNGGNTGNDQPGGGNGGDSGSNPGISGAPGSNGSYTIILRAASAPPVAPQVFFSLDNSPLLGRNEANFVYNQSYTISAEINGGVTGTYSWSLKNKNNNGSNGNILNISGQDQSFLINVDISNSIPLCRSSCVAQGDTILSPLVISFSLNTEGNTYIYDISSTLFNASLTKVAPTYTINLPSNKIYPNGFDDLNVTRSQFTPELSGNLVYTYLSSPDNNTVTVPLSSSLLPNTVFPIITSMFTDQLFISKKNITFVYNIDTYYTYISKQFIQNSFEIPITTTLTPISLDIPTPTVQDIVAPDFEENVPVFIAADVSVDYGSGNTKILMDGDLPGFTGKWYVDGNPVQNGLMSGPYNINLNYTASDTQARELKYELSNGGMVSTEFAKTLAAVPPSAPADITFTSDSNPVDPAGYVILSGYNYMKFILVGGGGSGNNGEQILNASLGGGGGAGGTAANYTTSPQGGVSITQYTGQRLQASAGAAGNGGNGGLTTLNIGSGGSGDYSADAAGGYAGDAGNGDIPSDTNGASGGAGMQCYQPVAGGATYGSGGGGGGGAAADEDSNGGTGGQSGGPGANNGGDGGPGSPGTGGSGAPGYYIITLSANQFDISNPPL
jgi:titin